MLAAIKQRRQFLTFTLIGVINTLFYLVLFNAFRLLGIGPFVANALAVVLSITFSFWANSRFTFRVDHGSQRSRRFAEFASVFVLTLIMSNIALWVLFRVIDEPTQFQESAALVIAGGGLFVVRYVIMSAWVFNPARSAS